MILRDFEADDQAEVRALILQGLAEHWGSVDESLNPDLDDIGAAYDSGRILVGGDGDRIIATGTIVPGADGTAIVVRMSVATDSRGGGLGRRVLEELIDTARCWGARRVILETTSAWHDVVAFYLGCGFSITHESDGEFGRDTWFEIVLDRS